jgi:hypothetical protein
MHLIAVLLYWHEALHCSVIAGYFPVSGEHVALQELKFSGTGVDKNNREIAGLLTGVGRGIAVTPIHYPAEKDAA